MDETNLANPKLPVLIFDDKCTLCLRFKTALDRLPGTEDISKMSLHDDNVYKIFPQLVKEECQKVVHLIDEKNTVLTGPQVITYLLEKFPGVQKFAWLLESNMGQKAIQIFNKVIENYREELQNECTGCNKNG